MRPVDMLDVLGSAVEEYEALDRRARKAWRLTLVAPKPDLLGQRGRRVAISEDYRGMYAFTIDQVRAMGDTLRNAIREDAGLPPLEPDRRH